MRFHDLNEIRRHYRAAQLYKDILINVRDPFTGKGAPNGL